MPPSGAIEVPLAEDEVEAAAELFAKRGMDAVIVAFLFSFLNDEHEQRAKEIVRRDPARCLRLLLVGGGQHHPRIRALLQRGDERLYRAEDFDLSRQSRRAGSAPTASAPSCASCSRMAASRPSRTRSELPIGLLLSGPAGGVIGGRWTGAQCGQDNIITIDIGGTSADISVIENGELRDQEPARHRGRRPAGAGADDRHRRDRRRRRLDRLYRSAAAPSASARARPGPVPGPACYGKGGEEPTVTDAQVVLGRLDPEHFLGGDLKIEPRSSAKAISEHIAEPLGMIARAGGARHPQDRQQQHGAGDQCQFGRQGRRPARLHADGLRRRRAAAFGVACRGDLAPATSICAGPSRHHRGDRAARHRPAV